MSSLAFVIVMVSVDAAKAPRDCFANGKTEANLGKGLKFFFCQSQALTVDSNCLAVRPYPPELPSWIFAFC